MQALILASQSPRRRELLGWLGLSFHTRTVEVDETPHPGEPPAALAVRLAETKARALDTAAPAALILAADTVVALEGISLGKPADEAEARAILTALQGKEHLVHTGVALRHRAMDRTWLRCVTTRVTMRPYSEADIAAYIATGDPFDKAGAYAIQHADFNPVLHLERCYANVVGLPLCAVLALLGQGGEKLAHRDAVALCREHFGYACPGPDWGEGLEMET